ncbi:hypothetical protein [Agrobacterium cavarae]|uniref:hypothetical protein n=1 Tax=Agrobacterium cavarae TaxID=2528239 RepID=UPI003FD4E260
MQVLLWKAGVGNLRALVDTWQGVAADPTKVDVLFLNGSTSGRDHTACCETCSDH